MVTINCLSCHKQVIVRPIKYGNGCIAVCPICGKLALNSDEMKLRPDDSIAK